MALWLVPVASPAHEYWLAPSTYRAAPGASIEVRAFAGTGFRGTPNPFAAPRTVRLIVRTDRKRDVAGLAVNGDPRLARFVLADGKGASVAFESGFTAIELSGPDFDRYLAAEGLDAPLAARRRAGANLRSARERYRRCAKTWISGSDLRRSLDPFGLPLEIVPLSDPTRGSPLAVRLVEGGRPLAGALVRAWRAGLAPGAGGFAASARDSSGPVAQARSDRRGIAVLAIRGAGEWLVSAVHMKPSRDRTQAEWESTWASLTFARSEPR